VDAATLDEVFVAARRLVPAVRREHAIKTFAANRPASEPTYRVARDGRVENLVHAAGIRSTGVSSSPAVAELVRSLLEGLGLPVDSERPGAVTRLEPLPRLLDHPRPEHLIAVDHRYGQVICACEQVTAAEIAAVHDMRVPPTSIEGVRKRTRATGGRCQGALCLAGVSFLHSIHAGVPPHRIAVSEPAGTLGVRVGYD
jgi:glycerol-3-phosphate dehydrogenase